MFVRVQNLCTRSVFHWTMQFKQSGNSFKTLPGAGKMISFYFQFFFLHILDSFYQEHWSCKSSSWQATVMLKFSFHRET